jgi:long-chain acyl-CoA synthetase
VVAIVHKKPLAVEPFNDFREMLINSRQKWGSSVALMEKIDGQWVSISYNHLFYNVMSFGCGLRKLGMQNQTKVAMASENRIRWGLAFLSVACGNAVCVPIDKELKSQEFFHILYTTETEIFVGSQKFVDMVLDIRAKLPHLRHIINMDDRAENSMVIPFSTVINDGKKMFEKNTSDYPFTKINPAQPVSILFTSGTTGTSKGVMLSQTNIIADLRGILQVLPIRYGETLLSVLPMHHTYECTGGFLAPLSHGMTIAFAENLKRIPDNLLEVQATMMLGVPLLFESIYNKIMERIADKGLTKFRIGKGIANLTEKLFHKNIRRKVFRPLHEKFGGKLWLLVSGGAAIAPEVSKGFREMGLLLLQGYGLTETSPVIALNLLDQFKDDSAGLPIPGAVFKIEEGEICIRGPMVMLGYYKNPEATAEVIRNGWFHTGDLGYFDEDGFLFIQGRKKAVIVTANGKNVYPEEVEAQLNRSPFILESLVWEGPDAHKYCEEVHAIIVPNIQYFDQYLSKQGSKISEEEVEKILKEEVKRLCGKLANYKKVKKFTIQWEEFEKTTTRKIKRYLYTSKIRPVGGRGK